MMNGGGVGGGLFGLGLMGFLLMLTIIVVIGWMVKVMINFRNSRDRNKRPMATLDERLARGEISEEVYDRIKRRLNMSKRD